jgi:NitT/TauT family transport system substrate-binding protein
MNRFVLSVQCLVTALGLWAGAAEFSWAAEPVHISGLTWPGYGFWFIAKEKGLAPELDISYQRIEDPNQSFNLLTAGKVDVVSSTIEFTPIGVESGMPLKLVAFGNLSYGTDKIIAAPKIDSAEDLKGKDVAVLEGGLAQIFMAMWLEKNGADFKSVNYKNLVADDALGAMVGGTVAAAEFWEPYSTTILTSLPGSKVLADSKDPYWTKQALIADAVFMNSDFIAKRHDVALKTMKALYDSIAWWKKNAAEGNAIIAKGMDMKLPDVELVLGKDGTGLDGGLYVYDFMETARFCGVAPGEPPFHQTNGQMKDHFALLNTWWKRFGLIKADAPYDKGVDCGLLGELYNSGYRG